MGMMWTQFMWLNLKWYGSWEAAFVIYLQTLGKQYIYIYIYTYIHSFLWSEASLKATHLRPRYFGGYRLHHATFPFWAARLPHGTFVGEVCSRRAQATLLLHGFWPPGMVKGRSSGIQNICWLVVWNMAFMTFHTLGSSSSQLTNSYFAEGLKPPPSMGHTVLMYLCNYDEGHI